MPFSLENKSIASSDSLSRAKIQKVHAMELALMIFEVYMRQKPVDNNESLIDLKLKTNIDKETSNE